ncbi:MAG: hypothetical protein LBO62_05955 [Endomicrobium sp.]|jgi:hypothetical protein|nr:hypothetical protein [Endomicrobium sp.]
MVKIYAVIKGNNMAEKEKKEEPIIIKAYLIVLFFCGVGLWFASSPSSDVKKTFFPKPHLSVDVDINNRVIDVLSAGGVKQNNIIKEYAAERSLKNEKWNEFYKTVRLVKKRADDFESSLRLIARSLGTGLSRTDNPDGSVTYKFYSTDKNYSNITFINPAKPANAKAANK